MLTRRQKEEYAAKGFLRVAAVLGAEDIAALSNEWNRLWRETDAEHPSVQWRNHDTMGRVADRLDPAYMLSPYLQSLCEDARLKDLAAAVLGGPAVLFKDKLISKLPGTHGYGLHQDWPYWSDYELPPNRLVVMMIALDAADVTQGALELWPGEMRPLPPDPDDPRDVDPAALDASKGEVVAMEAGDVLLFHPMTPHRSGPNRSKEARRTYFPAYVTADYAAIAAKAHGDRQQRIAGA